MELSTVWDICLWIFGITVTTPIVATAAGVVLVLLCWGLGLVYLIGKVLISVILFFYRIIKRIFCGADTLENQAENKVITQAVQSDEQSAGTVAETTEPLSKELQDYFEMMGNSEYKICDEWIRLEKKFGISEE
jgi:hypothetical protein